MTNHPPDLAPVLEGFFTKRLIAQRNASRHTIASYRDAFRLLLQFAQTRLGRPPSKLRLQDLDVALIGAFLDEVEAKRANSARTRNLRLTAIRSFFRFAALEVPEQAGLIQRGVVHPAQASLPQSDRLSDPCRNRSALGGRRPKHLDRAT